jgi:hypothetical protein
MCARCDPHSVEDFKLNHPEDWARYQAHSIPNAERFFEPAQTATAIGWPALTWHRVSPHNWWIRLFGHGINYRHMRHEKEAFSERVFVKFPLIQIGPHRLDYLSPWII